MGGGAAWPARMASPQFVDGILTERFGSHSPSPRRAESRKDIKVYRISERSGESRIVTVPPYFCPGCGVTLGEKMVCPECGVSIYDLLSQLVELFPHRDKDGS